jgi:hypothetical protein
MEANPITTQSVKLDRDIQLEIPFFSSKDLQDCFCARYARLTSKLLFDKAFPIADAWNMRKQPGIIVKKANSSLFSSKYYREKVLPGTMVGIYTPDSRHNEEERPYTHISLYLGEQNSQAIFLEQFIHEIRLMDLRDYELAQLEIKEIIHPKRIVVPNKA